jgi:hypothetical protein
MPRDGGLKIPDESSGNRNAEAQAPTAGMSLRTKGGNPGTVPKALRSPGRVRPVELYFFPIVLALAVLAPAGTCGSDPDARAPAAVTVTPPPAPSSTATPPPRAAAADLFASTVRPVLLAHCAPCHEPGGKMYERLPFENPTVVADHRAGVLRRLKGEDRETVEKWLATLPVPAPATP